MPIPSHTRLLHGPYQAPRLQVGSRTHCLLRDCLVIITSWTDAPISWPRCQPVGQRGGCGLLDEELARAVRCESASAIAFWWGVSEGVVWRWRKVLGVGRMDSEGSRLLILEAAAAGGEAVKAREFTQAEREVRQQNAKRLNLGQYLQTGYHGPRWTPEQLQLLGKEPDAVVAGKVGRSVNAVRVKRNRLEIPTARDGRRAKVGPHETGGRKLPPDAFNARWHAGASGRPGGRTRGRSRGGGTAVCPAMTSYNAITFCSKQRHGSGDRPMGNGQVLQLDSLKTRHPPVGEALLNNFGPMVIVRLSRDPTPQPAGTINKCVEVNWVRRPGKAGEESLRRDVGWANLQHLERVCVQLPAARNEQDITEGAAVGIAALLVNDLEQGTLQSVLPIGNGGDYLVRVAEVNCPIQIEMSGLREDKTRYAARARLAKKTSQVLTQARVGFVSVSTFAYGPSAVPHSYLHFVRRKKRTRPGKRRKN